MERELEKDLKEIEYLIYVHKNRGNTNTQSVLERVYEIIEPCAKAARTPSELEEILSRENSPEITRSSRDNDGCIPVDEQVPKERVRPICLDFDDYLVTINFGFGARVKTLKYGDGHWWNGPSIVDEYVIAWRTNPEPYHPERSNDEKE